MKAPEPGRTCAQPGCDVRLSRYNLAAWCRVHERLHPPRTFGCFVGKP